MAKKLDQILDSEKIRLRNYFNYIPERKLERSGPFCHKWTGPTNKDGYGTVQIWLDLKGGGRFKKNSKIM